MADKAEQKTGTTATPTPAPEAKPSGSEGDLDPNREVTVKVDGQDVTVTLDELRKGYSRQSDYTRKTQELAAKDKTRNTEVETLKKELDALKTTSAKGDATKDLVDRLRELTHPEKPHPLSSKQAFDEAFQADPALAVEASLRGIAGTPGTLAEQNKTLANLQEQLKEEKKAREELTEQLQTKERERQAGELERQIINRVPEYSDDERVWTTTRIELNSDKPSAKLGNKIGKDTDPVEVARLAAAYWKKYDDDKLQARLEEVAAKKSSLTLGNEVSQRALPEVPDEIEKIKNPLEKLQAKTKWYAQQKRAAST